MKKRLLSLTMIMAILTSIIAISTHAASAATNRIVNSITVTATNTLTGINVTWNKYSNINQYRLYVKPKNTKTWSSIVVKGTGYTLNKSTTLPFSTVKTLKSGTEYHFQVQPLTNSKTVNTFSHVLTHRYMATANLCGQYQNDAYDVTNRVYWAAVPGANWYEVQRYDPDQGWINVYANNGTQFYDVSGLMGKHKYRINAMYCTPAGIIASESAWAEKNFNWQLSQDQAEKIVYSHLKNRGFTRGGAAATMAVIYHECGFTQSLFEKTTYFYPGSASGLLGWDEQNLLGWDEQNEQLLSHWNTNLITQVDYLVDDMKNKYENIYHESTTCRNKVCAVKTLAKLVFQDYLKSIDSHDDVCVEKVQSDAERYFYKYTWS